MGILRRFWPLVALLAGVALAFLELRKGRGVNADNAFWLLVAGLIVVMAVLSLFQKPPAPPGGDRDDPSPPPPNRDVP